MKKLLITIIILCLNSAVFANVTFTVKVKNANKGTSISIISDYYYFDKTPIEISKLNEEGTGVLQIDIKQERFLIIDIGFRTVRLLVKPNKNYIIAYDNNRLDEISFEGFDTNINVFLEKTHHIFLSFTYNNKIYIDWEEYTEFPNGMKGLEHELFKSFYDFYANSKISNLDSILISDYLRLEILQIKRGIFRAKFDVFFSESPPSIPVYYQNIDDEITLNDSYFKTGYYVYQYVLRSYLDNKVSKTVFEKYGNMEQFKKRFPSNFIEQFNIEKLEIIGNSNIPQISKSYGIANVLVNEIEKESVLEPLLNDFKKKYPDSEYTSYIEKKLLKIKKIELGVTFPKITGTDIEENSVEISQYLGKIIYIDIWATWCGPCIQEIPNSIKLQEHFKENKNLVFLNISIDQDIGKWKQFLLTNKKFTGKHINISKEDASKLMESLMINGIPRYVLVDKEGKMIIPNAPKPSEEGLIQLLSSKL